jgi:hypothetical protein
MQPKLPAHIADQIAGQIANQGEQLLPSEKSCSINQLLAQGTLWRASDGPTSESTHTKLNKFTTTGFSAIDALLYYRGWPKGQLIECLQSPYCQHVLTPFLPAIHNMTGIQQTEHSKKKSVENKQADVILINPPNIPYQSGWGGEPPLNIYVISTHTLKNTLWACEQALRSRCSQSIFIWLPEKNIPFSQLRKLQLAAQYNKNIFVVFRPQQFAQKNSPAALRFKLSPIQCRQKTALQIHILKQPGCWGGQKATIHWQASLQHPFIPAKYWPVYQTREQLSQRTTNAKHKKFNSLDEKEPSVLLDNNTRTEKKWS